MKHKVLSRRHFPRMSVPLKFKFIAVLRVLGIYTIDQLKRINWDEVGKYKAQKGRACVEKYGEVLF
jgi:hypothetical protein